MQTLSALLALGIAVTAVVLLARARPALVGTTLTAPWAWSLAALVALGTLAVASGLLGPDCSAFLSHARYATGALSFLPVMAVLGASRPRDRGWPAVMVGLLVILLLPAGENWLWRPGARLVLEGARAWFLAILIGLGFATYLGTRYWPSALGLAEAQTLLLLEFLPGAQGSNVGAMESYVPLLALLLAFAAIELARRAKDLRKPRDGVGRMQDFDRLWGDFRDAFGTLWGLRVIERMNASAKMYGWPVTLTWNGLATAEGEPGSEGSGPSAEPLAGRCQKPPEDLAPEVWAQLFGVFENLLLRFVSPPWIAERKRAP